PEELYLTAEELRAEIDRRQRIEMRALGRTAAKIDQEIALDAEQPKISVGKARAKKQPLFLFVSEPGADRGPHAGSPGGVVVATGSNSPVGSHDPLAMARGTVTEILREYEVNARLTSFEDTSESPAVDAVVTFGKLSGGFELIGTHASGVQ